MLKSIITDQISMDLEVALVTAKKFGFSCVELHGVWGKTIEDCSDEEVDDIKRLLDKYDMRVSNLATTIFLMCKLRDDYEIKPFENGFVVTAGETLDEHLEALKRASAIAKKLDCENIRIFPFRYPENHVVVGTETDLELIVRNFKKALEIIKNKQITLVVENCPYSHCPKVEMTNRLVSIIENPKLKLLYDPANSFRADIHRVPAEFLTLSTYKEIPLVHENIRHVHLKNYHFDSSYPKPFQHTTIGTGDLDFTMIMRQLSDVDYDGALSLEPEIALDLVPQCLDEFNEIYSNIIKAV